MVRNYDDDTPQFDVPKWISGWDATFMAAGLGAVLASSSSSLSPSGKQVRETAQLPRAIVNRMEQAAEVRRKVQQKLSEAANETEVALQKSRSATRQWAEEELVGRSKELVDRFESFKSQIDAQPEIQLPAAVEDLVESMRRGVEDFREQAVQQASARAFGKRLGTPRAPLGSSIGWRERDEEKPALYSALQGTAKEFGARRQKRRQQKWEARRDAAANISAPGREIAVVTTACLPWMTGTSVNPALRAAFLARDGSRRVTLVVPFLPLSDQRILHPQHTFSSPEEQEEHVREWLRNRVGFEPDLQISFYPGRYATDKMSILPVGDVTDCIPDRTADVAVLEEPEHLTWYHHGRRWTDKFRHVVGIIHTNYLEYARREEHGDIKAALLRHVNVWCCRTQCHKVVRLSGAVQDLPRSETCNVHGVSPRFLEVGRRKASEAQPLGPLSSNETASLSVAQRDRRRGTKGMRQEGVLFPKGVYFIGKTLWAKGYTELLSMFSRHKNVHVDVYGNGDEFGEVRAKAAADGLDMTFHGAKDHGHADIHDYKVFVNPSLSDVVATTTAEALAMGKFVVVAEHPSNEFFATFDNCLVYRTPEEFSECLHKALSSEPKPMTESDLHRLTWEAATDRFMEVAEPTAEPAPGVQRKLENLADFIVASAHNRATSSNSLRELAGAGSDTLHAPLSLCNWDAAPWSNLGLFDRTIEPKK